MFASTTRVGLIQALGRMSNTRVRHITNAHSTFGERFAAAFGSLLFSLPVIGVLWFLFNSQVALFADKVLSVTHLAVAAVVVSLFSFLFPQFAPAIVSWLWRLLYKIGKWF